MWAESQSIHDHCGPRSEQPCRSFLASSLIASSTSQSAKEPKFTFSSRPAVVWISYLSRYACCTPCIDLVPCVLLLLKALNRPHPAAYWNLSSSRQNGLGCIHSASIYQSTPIGGWQLHFQLPQTRVGSERERERERASKTSTFSSSLDLHTELERSGEFPVARPQIMHGMDKQWRLSF